MSTKKNKKITLNEIIARKQQGKLDKLQVKKYYCEELGGDIELHKLPLNDMLELIDSQSDETTDTTEAIRLNAEMIYKSCPIIHQNSKKLLEVYDIKDPIMLPLAILNDNIGEMNKMADAILGFYGLDQLNETVKN